MRNCCPAVLLLTLVSWCAPPARGADGLPPIGRQVHGSIWSGETFLSLPQVEPLEWETLDYEPRWTLSVGAVILQRARPASTPFVSNPVSGATIFNADNFVFPFQGGSDVGLVRHGAWADVEFRYFGVNDWDDRQGPVFAPDGIAIPLNGLDPLLDPVTTAAWFRSSLNSVELNLRRQVLPRWSLLAGFRYVSLRERMALYEGAASLDNGAVLAFKTVNDLFGLQIGAEGTLCRPGPRFRIDVAFKAGVFANAAGSRISLTSVPDPGPDDGWVSLHRDHTAFVGDMNFVGVYQIDQHWALRGGYQLLWLAGVAVPNEQFQNLDFNTGQVSTNTTHGAFFHGALLGLERTW